MIPNKNAQISDFIEKLKDKNISLYMENNLLKYRSPKGVLVDEILKYLKDNKENIIAYLKEQDGESLYFEPVAPAQTANVYPVSLSQRRMYLLQQLDLQSTAYNIVNAFRVNGSIEREKVHNILCRLIQRHESLRTYFEMAYGEIVQIIKEDVDFILEYEETEKENRVDYLINQFTFPHDLSKAPLLRSKLVKVKEGNYYVLVIDMHHIISDGTSGAIMAKEFNALFNDLVLFPITVQYKDFVEWQRKLMQSNIINKQKQHWANQLNGEIPVLQMPYDIPRPPLFDFKGDSIMFSIDADMTSKIIQICRNLRVTYYAFLLSSFAILLSKYTGQSDIIIGTPNAGRVHADFLGTIGMFVNTLPIRTFPQKEKSVSDFIKEIFKNTLQAFDNQAYPFEQMVEDVNAKRDLSRNPIFDIMFVLQSIEVDDLTINDAKISRYQYERKSSYFDFTLFAEQHAQGTDFELNYCNSIYSKETAQRMSRHFLNILKIMANNHRQNIVDLNFFLEAEIAQIKNEFNDTASSYPKNETIHGLFTKRALKMPEKLAVVCSDKKVTYGELEQMSNRIAQLLVCKGVKKSDFVAVMAKRSVEMIAAILGITKAGAALVPIDPAYSEERIKYMLDDCNVDVIITQKDYTHKATHITKRICLDSPEIEESHKLTQISQNNHILYAIYTSGTTGNPKGVLFTHNNMINLIYHDFNKENIDFTKNILQFSTMCFDMYYHEVFAALLAGGCLHIIDENDKRDTNVLLNFISDNKIETIFLPTAFFKCIANEEGYIEKIPSCVKHILVAGEQLIVPESFLDYMNKTGICLHNHYGPSETHVVTTFTVDSTSNKQIPPIGKPITNTKIYIMDQDLKILPVGIPGELYVSGESVGPGYIGNEELTNEKFIEDVFSPSGKMYKTGDLVKWLPDGNIDFLGRIDTQVKIRGYRVEVGEIESMLIRHRCIKEAAVVAKVDRYGENYLCAYVVTEPDITDKEIKQYLSSNLPDYMVARQIVKIEQIPLTTSGKLDASRLPVVNESRDLSDNYEEPVSETEVILADIWSELLDVSPIGAGDNFFDLGGHSLKATVLVSKIYKRLGVTLKLSDIFHIRTLRDMAETVDSSQKSEYNPINPAEKKDYYRQSPSQRRLFVLNKMATNTAYNMPMVMVAEGMIDKSRFRYAFNQLIKRHEALRTSFELIDGEPVQIIHKNVEFDFSYITVNEYDIEQIIKEFIKPFDLKCPPLMRVGLIEVKTDRFFLVFDIHHILSDAVSSNIIGNEFVKLYNNESLEELEIQYKDYSEWLNKRINLGELAKQEEYWLKIFRGELPVLNLPADHKRPLEQSYEGSTLSFEADKELTQNLNNLADEKGCTLYMVLLAALNILLAKYSETDDIIVGSPIAGRNHPDIEQVVGVFINTLAMRNFPSRDKRFSEFLAELKSNSLSAYENQEYPFEELVERLGVRRDIGRTPLFDVMFILQNATNDEIQLDDISFCTYEYELGVSIFDLTLQAREVSGTIKFFFEYAVQIFDKSTIARFIDSFLSILHQITDCPEKKIGKIDVLSESDKKKLLFDFCHTKADYPHDKTIHQLFEEQVERTPDNMALVFGDNSMIYGELNAKSNQLARILRKKGVKPDSIVGIMMERSFEMIIGILGILKAGGAYLPLDPEYPKERIRFMLEDSGAIALLTQSLLSGKVVFSGEILELGNTTVYNGIDTNLKSLSCINDLAYVIYTSGSTGNPKGVMIEHRGVVNLCINQINRFKVNEFDRILQFYSFSFDPSVEQIFTAIFSGASLYLIDKDDLLDYAKFTQFMRENAITHLDSVPSFLGNLNLDGLDHLKRVISSGEVCPIGMIERLNKDKKCEFYNSYGPTETTVTSNVYLIKPEEIKNSVPIGKPIGNYIAYIFNKDKMLSPIGVPGELCISGDGLARGYINQPELTAQKFMENPLVLGERMYRTGDLAKWLPDGNIEFLGRIDHQVKIRGFRVELGEIENRLLEIEAVKEAIVLARVEKSGGKCLCAYVVAEEELSVKGLWRRLAESLPDYMVPYYFVQLAKLPLTSNGKVDRKALPVPEGVLGVQAEYEAPRNQSEEVLARIWSEVLDIEKIGIRENFFELGGHSLKGMVMTSRIHKELNVELPLMELFKTPTIAEISGYLGNAKTGTYTWIEAVKEKEVYEASSAQKRMYVLHQLGPDAGSYNMPAVMTVDGVIEKERFEAAISKLIKRHEVLRTSFETIGDQVVQRIHKDTIFSLEYAEKADEYEKNGDECINEAVRGFIRPFDLTKAPLLHVGLIKLAEEKHLLLFDVHHIISDGTSIPVLTREFADLYTGKDLKGQRIQYKDFSEWQNAYLKSEEMQEQEKYWLKRFTGEIPVLNMPLDYTRPAIQEFVGSSIKLDLGKKLSGKLKNISQETGATLYMVLLSVVNILLSKYTGQEDIIIGSPIAGRPHADLENILGMFVNTLAMRNYPKSNKTYAEFLSEVKENALRAYENQGYQFEELVDKLELCRDMSRNPLFDVMFVLQNTEETKLEVEGLKFTGYESVEKTVKFDLTFTAMETGKEIQIDIEYCTSLFNNDTIKRLSGHLNNLLKVITENKYILLGEIDILSEEERKRILHGFNDTCDEYPREKTIHQLFEDQVERCPGNVALVFNDHSMTYGELNSKSNQVARILREKGVRPNSIVGIMLEHSFEMIIGILGVLKASGAYLPINQEYPAERINYMLGDSNSRLLLTDSELNNSVVFNGDVINLKHIDLDPYRKENLDCLNNANDLVYIIYTSGSTGRPKGTMIHHQGLVNYICWSVDTYLKGKNDSIALFTSISFDLTMEPLFMPLISGNKAIIYKNDKTDFVLYKILRDNKATVIKLTPTHLAMLKGMDNRDSNVRILIVGGEDLKASLAKEVNDSFGHVEIYNSYGPTEASIGCTICKYQEKNDGRLSVPIGVPIYNTQIYILDKNLNVVPIGVAGELCISGDGLACGYLNLPELTAEKFVGNPFILGTRMYRTGDMARWLPDGNIEFLGRIDEQVKIRGFRIELGEIENRLLALGTIKEAVVMAKEDKAGDKYLCAYIVSEEEILSNELRRSLSEILPEYMVPAHFIRLNEMPLNSSGKLDKKALPVPNDGLKTDLKYVSPRSQTEGILAKMWSEILGIEKVGIHDSFFELGGHSLKGTVLASRIHKKLNVELPLIELFKTPTIAGISEYLAKAKPNIYASIEAVKKQEVYEVSSAQKRMYVLQQLDPDAASYNIPAVLTIDGILEKEKLEVVVWKLLERHEVLRTSFETIEDQVVQRIHKDVAFEIEYAEKVEEYCENTDKCIDKLVKEFIRPFDLSKAPLLRVGLIKLAEDKHLLLFDVHHIISDGLSMLVLTREFTDVYRGKELEDQRIQYKDFSEWQNAYLKSESMQKQERYWLERFSGEIPVLNMPLDYVRPVVQEFGGHNIAFRLSEELSKKIKTITKETGTTLYMVLLSAVNILLAKYSGQEDIIVGSPIAGRPHADLENILGMFVNTLAMRNYPMSNKTYEEFLSEVKKNALRAYENQEYQFEELIDKLDLRRNMSRNPLFDVMFTLQNVDTVELRLSGLKLMEYIPSERSAKFDLSFTVFESGGNILFDIEYCVSLFKKETIELLGGHLINIFNVITEDRSVLLGKINILSEEEKNRIQYEFNDTYTEYPQEKTIHQLFEEQAERTPNNIALIFSDEQMTYSELNAKSNQLARVLRARGLRPNSTAGIMADRSFEMIIGILGILKAGAAYLPIDLEYPKDRIRFILEDSKACVLLTQSTLRGKASFEGKIIELDDDTTYEGDIGNLDSINCANDLAYVIYTSGSTGKPKGVMVEHSSVVNLLYDMERYYPLGKGDAYLLKTAYTFDASVPEIFGWFIAGEKLVILPPGYEGLSREIINTVYNNKITHIYFVPSTLNVFLDELKNYSSEKLQTLKYVFTIGEALKQETVRAFYKHIEGAKLENVYGPAEATVYVSRYSTVVDEKLLSVPIGKPASNVSIHIIGKHGNIQPINLAGEICISGACVARGYLNRAELTAEKFGENPLVQNERMYRTGDLGRWLPDGNIEFLGRIDYQVKIRGFRIELGEIESRLLEIVEVKEAAVMAHEDEMGDKYLCGYIVSDDEISVKDIRERLFESLPDYMVPAYFVRLEAMPLNPSGKVDRKALPAPDGAIMPKAEYVAPRNQMEEFLAKIWSEVLGIEKISIHDDFFELGGHSLKGTILVSRIHKELNLGLPLKELFRTPTIVGISEYLSKMKPSAYSSIEAVEVKDYYETSSAQKRMYVLQQLDLEMVSYNMPVIMTVEGILEKERLETAIWQLIERHEVLRTSFETVEDRVVQRVRNTVTFAVEYTDKTEEYSESIKECVDKEVKHFIRPFDLCRAPLLRVGLIKLAEEKHLLLFDIHHIISDGTSLSVLVKEFTEFYEDKELNPQRIQYKDFSEWQNAYLKSDAMREQEKYWLERLSGELPVLNMPLDYQRPAIQEFDGSSIEFKLGKELSRKLRDVTKETGATLYMVLLSAINILLLKYTGQEDIIVGSPIAGRLHVDLENMLGMFVNALAMRNKPESGKTYRQFLSEVKENALKAYENQEYQFEELVEKLDLRREMSKNPLFDVMFALQNVDESILELEGLRFVGNQPKENVAKFDLEFTAIESGDEILFNIDYGTSLFKHGTVEWVGKHLRNLLKSIVKDRDIRLGDIDILSKEERDRILYEFNNTCAEYPRDKAIHQLFEEQAKRTPDNVALVFNDDRMTYDELNAKSNQIALVLRAKGVRPDDLVGIMVERSFEMIIGILGILKSGGAYLPIDSEYPEERIRFILDDSEAKILLTQSWLSDKLEFDGDILELDYDEFYTGSDHNFEVVNQPSDLAYVIYTSGSTGVPKGVMVEHKNIVNFCYNIHTQPLVRELNDKCDYIYADNKITFDITVQEIFLPLLNGLGIVIAKDVMVFHAIGQKNLGLISTPTKFNNYLMQSEFRKKLEDFNVIMLGAEELKISLINRIFENQPIIVFNGYGPTEATCGVLYYQVNSNNIQRVPIGKPISNTKVYVLNGKQPSGIGVTGELCLSGDGLARGYLKRPELTAEKFVDNPFIPGERMYRTGDLARWLPDGNIEFLGRIDHQVKIRGFRIELGEIENCLMELKAVKEAVILAREDESGDKYLCAYVVAEGELSIKELREHLTKSLPDYMIPSYFVQLTELPLNPSGKIDRKALPESEGILVSGIEYVAPRTEEEKVIAGIFREVLGIKEVGAMDDFFMLGGDSIKAIRIVSKLREAGYVLSVRDLMKNPTVEQSGRIIRKCEEGILYEQGEVKGESLLIPIQRWFFESNLPKQNHFNQSIMLRITERVETEMVTAVFGAIVKHHDILRAVYKNGGQEILSHKDNVGYELREYDYRGSGLKGTELAKDIEAKNNELQVSINIETGPIMKVGLFKTDEADHLMICIHHLAVDGVSWRILIEDIEIGCKHYLAGSEIKFSEKTASYKDWGSALGEYSKSNLLKREIKYWKQVAEMIKEGMIQKSDTGEEGSGHISVVLEKEETDKLLYRSSKAFGTEINDLLLSGLGLAVRNLTGQEKVSVNLEGHGREVIHKKINIDRTVGWFTSIYPVVIGLSNDTREMIISTKEVLRKVPNKGLGYGVLKYLSKEAFNQEKVEVTFNYLGSVDAEIGTHALIFGASLYSQGIEVAKENLQKDIITLNCIITGGKLNVGISYRKDKLTDEEANYFGVFFKEALMDVINTCVNQKETIMTSSDFGISNTEITQAEIEEILSEL